MIKKISIITSTFNAEKSFQNLIDSMRVAKRPNVQWVVVDGNSTDGTCDIANKSSDVIDTFMSESDTGIYHAWNKGLKLVDGDYIAFIGADDYIAENYFDEALKSIDDKHNLIGFKIKLVGQRRNKILHSFEWEKPWNFPFDMAIHHQGTLHSKYLFVDENFNESFKIIGDREFLTRKSEMLVPKIHITPDPLIFFSMDGTSSNPENIKIIYKELFRIIKKNQCKRSIVYLELMKIVSKIFLAQIGLHRFYSYLRTLNN